MIHCMTWNNRCSAGGKSSVDTSEPDDVTAHVERWAVTRSLND